MFTGRSRPGGRSYQISAANETISHENGITISPMGITPPSS